MRPPESKAAMGKSPLVQPCPYCGASPPFPRLQLKPFVEAELEDGEAFVVAVLVANAVVCVICFVQMPRPAAIASVVGLLALQSIAAVFLKRRSRRATARALESSSLYSTDSDHYQNVAIRQEVIPSTAASPSTPASPVSADPTVSPPPPVVPTLQPLTTFGEMSPSLDLTQLERRRRETAAAQDLLASWTESTSSSSRQSASTSRSALIESLCNMLDDDYRPFARQILSRATWTKDEFTALARSCYVMASDGLDRINSAALELTGEPWLRETENQVTVNPTGFSE